MSTAVAAFTLFVRASVTNNSLHFDKCRTVKVFLPFFNCSCNSTQIITVFNEQRLPAISIETLSYILREAQVKLAIQRNVIGVI
ncbi:hypothetical protein D3C86_1647640 [compost metagenome]